jgi:hypothetical protein
MSVLKINVLCLEAVSSKSAMLGVSHPLPKAAPIDLDRGRGRQRRRENGVKMAWHIHTWAQHVIFTSSLTSASSI